MLCGDDFRSRYFNKWKIFNGFLFVCLFLFIGFFETGFLCVVLAVLELTHSVDQAGLELRNLPASDSQVLGSKACATTVWSQVIFIYNSTWNKSTFFII